MATDTALGELEAALWGLMAGVGRSCAAAGIAGALATAGAVHGQLVFHVDDDAAAGGDGLSWTSAYRELQDAIGAAQARGGSGLCTIKVAAGAYTPDRGTRNRAAAFVMATSGVTLMGGFAGTGFGAAQDPDEHDPARFVSVLSGDLARNDAPGWANRSDNSYSVVVVDGPSDVQLRDVVVRGAEALFSTDSGVNIRRASYVGLIRCTIIDNRGGAAGGVDGRGAYSLSILGCRIEENSGDWGAGGVMGRELWVWGSRVRMNRLRSSFGGSNSSEIGVDPSGRLVLEQSLVAGAGGVADRAVIRGDGATLILRSSTVVQASAGLPALHAGSGSLVMVNSIVSGGDRACELGFAATVSAASSCLHVVGGRSALTGSLVILSDGVVFSNPRFVSATGADGNAATVLDNDYRLSAQSGLVDLGDTQWLGNDFLDVDGDGDWQELLPLDLVGSARVVDDARQVNRVEGARGPLDVGAFEFQGVLCRGDFDGSGVLAVGDVLLFVGDWLAGSPDADFDRSGTVGSQDLFEFLSAWFAGC